MGKKGGGQMRWSLAQPLSTHLFNPLVPLFCPPVRDGLLQQFFFSTFGGMISFWEEEENDLGFFSTKFPRCLPFRPLLPGYTCSRETLRGCGGAKFNITLPMIIFSEFVFSIFYSSKSFTFDRAHWHHLVKFCCNLPK